MTNQVTKRIFFALMICISLLKAQKNTKLVLDARTRLPIDYVYISTEDKKLSAVTNKEGRFVFITSPKVSNYTFFKLGYINKTLSVSVLQKTDTIYLEEKSNQLDEITVKASIMDTIVRDKRFYVDDYLALSNTDFLIITSKININGFELSFYQKGKGITCTRKINKEKNPFLFTDVFNNIHVVTDDYSRQILFNTDSSFEFLPKYRRGKYDSSLALTVLKIDSTVIIKQEREAKKISVGKHDYKIPSPYLSFVQGGKSVQRPFYTVYYTKDLINMLQSEKKDEEMISQAFKDLGVKQPDRTGFIANFYTNVLIPIYAPMFMRNDTVILFDFQQKQIVFLSKQAQVLKTVEMNNDDFNTMHHQFEVLYDKGTKAFYFKTHNANRSFLSRINVYEGTTSKKINLQKIFAQNLQVLNNRLYYLVKEHEWDDTRYLYQQNL
jgi:hypothetical protein